MVKRSGNVPDAAVECSWSEAESLADIVQKQVSLYFALQSDFCSVSAQRAMMSIAYIESAAPGNPVVCVMVL